jgi:hypothetical protein
MKDVSNDMYRIYVKQKKRIFIVLHITFKKTFEIVAKL